MRVPFLRSSPAARSTSNTAKRRAFLAGLLGGVDTAAGSLAFANFLSPRTQWGRVFDPSKASKARQCFFDNFVRKLRHLCRGVATWLLLVPAPARRSRLHQPERRYNTLVSAVSPQPDLQPSRKRPDKLRIYKLEGAASLIIGALILLLTLTPSWHHIVWGAR